MIQYSQYSFHALKDVPEGWKKVKDKDPLWRFLYPTLYSDRCIVLRSHHNKWVSVEDDGQTVSNIQTKISRWEKFELTFTGDGFVGLKTWKDKYLSSQPNGTLEANKDDLNEWEKFEMFINGDEKVAIRSTQGKWLSAQQDGTMEVNRDNLDIWETFRGWKDDTIDKVKGKFCVLTLSVYVYAQTIFISLTYACKF